MLKVETLEEEKTMHLSPSVYFFLFILSFLMVNGTCNFKILLNKQYCCQVNTNPFKPIH